MTSENWKLVDPWGLALINNGGKAFFCNLTIPMEELAKVFSKLSIIYPIQNTTNAYEQCFWMYFYDHHFCLLLGDIFHACLQTKNFLKRCCCMFSLSTKFTFLGITHLLKNANPWNVLVFRFFSFIYELFSHENHQIFESAMTYSECTNSNFLTSERSKSQKEAKGHT